MEERKRKVDSIKDWLQVMAIVTAALWAIWKFIYEDRILPERIPPHVIMTSEMEKIGQKNSLLAIRVRINVHNSSSRKVNVLTSWYQISAAKIRAYELDDSTFSASLEENMNGQFFTRLPRNFYDEVFQIIEAGKFLDNGWWFEADEKSSVDFVVYIPENKYDLIRLLAGINVGKNVEPFVFRWNVTEDCKFEQFTYLKMEGFEQDSSRVELYDPLGKHKKLQQKYHLVMTQTNSELSLW